MSNATGGPTPTVRIRQNTADLDRFFFDFDAAAPGGRGGASVRLDFAQGLASIDGIHRNAKLPPRSTGVLVAEGLRQAGMPKPAVFEAFNVTKSTAAVLEAGGDGQRTVIGNMLEDAALALGGVVAQWEPVKDGAVWHLRIQLSFP